LTQVAEEYTNKELMAAFVASEIKDDETVSVGASLPVCRAGILLAHLTHAPSLKVQMAFTMTNLRNVEVLESFEFITDWRAARWAEFLYNHDIGPDLYKRRRQAVFFIGGLQIDPYGNTNLIGIGGDFKRLKMRGPGGVGTASMATNIGRYYLYVNNHN
jgi:glutaconate CoA-transferase subunit B